MSKELLVPEIINPLPRFKEPIDLDEAKLLINQLGTNMHEHAYLVGKILIWTRDKIGTTRFENEWILNNVWFCDRTAYRFMGFTKKCDKLGHLIDYHPRKLLPTTDTVSVPEGQYSTIIIDPPWPIKKIERYEAPYQEPDFDYKEMTIEAIKQITLPAADNCHLFLWTTQKYLPVSFEILNAWEFKYIFAMVWHKAGGFQPFNLPQYNCEFAIYGRKGSPKFLETKSFFTCLNGKRREHSRKPVEFYDLIRRVCPEPRIDIFSREKINGFDSFGDEIDKF